MFFFSCGFCFVLFQMVMDALLLCFCEDCDMNDGSPDRPYFASKRLMVSGVCVCVCVCVCVIVRVCVCVCVRVHVCVSLSACLCVHAWMFLCVFSGYICQIKSSLMFGCIVIFYMINALAHWYGWLLHTEKNEFKKFYIQLNLATFLLVPKFLWASGLFAL